MSQAPSGPLAGLRVADFSRVLAGPYATMMLGDLGADVTKVERPPRGDDTRTWGPPHAPDGTATYFQSVNRNKRTVWLDLADPEDRAEALELALSADVLVENFAPGTMARFGLDHDVLAARNPRLVYASITGFGTGAGAAMPGYDLLVQAMGGLMSITGPTPDQPTKVGVALVDVITGLHATVGILAALNERTMSGRGQHVAVNLLSSTLSALVNQSQAAVGSGVTPRAMGNAHPSIAPYQTLPTADGVIALAVGNDGQFAALCEVLGLDLAADPDFATNPARVARRDTLAHLIAQALAPRPTAEWVSAFTAAGVPAGPVNDIPSALALAESLGLSPIVDAAGVQTVANPIGLSRTPVDYRLPPPQPSGYTPPGPLLLIPPRMSDFQRPPTAQEAVLVEVRARIIRGELAPGTPLRQDELAADLGVSRVPLREALRMLESEGHVSYAPHRGYRVLELRIDDLEEIYHLRALIEDDLALRAVSNQGADDVAAVRRAHRELSAAETQQPADPVRLAAANRAFHWAILRPPPRAERILTTLWDASEAHRARWFADPANVTRGAEEHATVLAAVLAGDGEAVVSHLAEHRAGAIEVLRAALDQSREPQCGHWPGPDMSHSV